MKDADSLLFSRLSWVSPLVREKAAITIGGLIASGSSTCSLQRVLDWVEEQTLEYRAVLGLLPIVKASQLSSDVTFDADDLAKSVKAPSVLSNLVGEYLGAQENQFSPLSSAHSGSAPEDFQPPEFFDKFARSFTSPRYRNSATDLERILRVPFLKQWAFEWQTLVDREGVTPDARSLDFRGRPPHDPILAIIETKLSDIYLSAYLRAVSWAIQLGKLDDGLAKDVVSDLLPVNLDLWAVEPSEKPSWWPQRFESSSALDIVPGQILEKLGDYWFQMRKKDESEVVVAACGVTHQTTQTFYEITVRAMIQKAAGPDVGDAEEIMDWADGLRAQSYFPPTRLNGEIIGDSISAHATSQGDWQLLALSANMVPVIGARWQYWRLIRNLQTLTPVFGRGNLSVKSAADGIEFYADDERVGRYSDWADGLTERTFDGLPPSSGYILAASRKQVDELCSDLAGNFVWAARVTCYFRENDYDSFEDVSTFKLLGTSSIILPGTNS